jgi:hypothetical protein
MLRHGTSAAGVRKACALVGLGAAIAIAACAAGSAEPKPTAALSSSVGAEGDMRAILTDWARATASERIGMEERIDAFIRRYPNDPFTGMAYVLLSWIALDQGDPRVALERARQVPEAQDGGVSTIADVAHTVEGAALRRLGKPEEALVVLEPRVSKLLDAWARSLLNAEIVDAAVQAGRWEKALRWMAVWLREAGADERATVRDHLSTSLDRVPAAELSRWLARPRNIELGAAAEDELEMRRLVAHRLAMVARETKDSALASRLIASAGALLGDQSDFIAQLAAGANRARVEARTVGLLLSLRNDKTRRRGADIADGVAFGLGLPGSAARLVSRDDHGDDARIEEALAALSADGAAVVIAGSDEREATVAAAFAQERQIPVILLRPPAQPDPKARFTFIAGVDPVELESALITALAAHGASPVAVLADEPIRPRAPRPEVAAVRGCSEAAASWKPLGVGGVVLSAQGECARAALVAAAPLRLRFAAGFEADAIALPPGSVMATAGVFPVPLGGKPKPLEPWLKNHPTPPGWWTAVGRDAAVLAWAGVQALPEQGTEEPREVAARRAAAAAALATAQAELWTTEARGFGGGRVLPRTVGVREVGK